MNILHSLALGAGLVAAGLGHAAPPLTRYLDRPPGRIAYDDSGGSGPLVIAMPGMGDLRAQYRLLRPELIEAGYRVVTMDVRGQGESSARWDDYSAQAAADDALAILDRLGVARAVLVGNSFAAGAGLWAARARPGAVRAVAMLGPILRDQPVSPFVQGLVELGMAGPWRVGFWMRYWDSLFTQRPPADHDAYRARLSANLREPGRMDALRTMLGVSKHDTAALVGTVTVPILVVMGSRDPDFSDPAQEAAWIAGQTPAQVVIVEGAGHYPHVEQPERVAAALTRFLDALAGP